MFLSAFPQLNTCWLTSDSFWSHATCLPVPTLSESHLWRTTRQRCNVLPSHVQGPVKRTQNKPQKMQWLTVQRDKLKRAALSSGCATGIKNSYFQGARGDEGIRSQRAARLHFCSAPCHAGRQTNKPTDIIASERKYGTKLRHTEQSRQFNRILAPSESDGTVVWFACFTRRSSQSWAWRASLSPSSCHQT